MFLNKIIPVMMGALLLCLIVVNCERDLTTPIEDEPNDQGKEYIKDGIMTLITNRLYQLPDGSRDRTLDSLFVSETEHRIDIDNGVPFEVPEMWNLEISFLGDFDGMPNKIFYIFRYKRESKNDGIIEEWISGQVTNNRTGVILTSLGNTAFDIQGLLFGLDSDTEHSGSGTVIIEHANVLIDTVFVDTQKNTVVFGAKATYMPIVLNSSDICIDVQIFDRYSFFDENNIVVWFVEDDSTKWIDDFDTSLVNGQFLAEKYGSHVKLWAFSTCFQQITEINDE